MRIEMESRVRPCVVDGFPALFHGFFLASIRNTQLAGEAIPIYRIAPVAVVEMQDGRVREITPTSRVTFRDSAAEFSQYCFEE